METVVEKPTMVGYKAFGSGFICNNYQYTPGGFYEHVGELKICHHGFHFCQYSADVLLFYPLKMSPVFARVSAYVSLVWKISNFTEMKNTGGEGVIVCFCL
jgi:hypothetical protein